MLLRRYVALDTIALFAHNLYQKQAQYSKKKGLVVLASIQLGLCTRLFRPEHHKTALISLFFSFLFSHALRLGANTCTNNCKYTKYIEGEGDLHLRVPSELMQRSGRCFDWGVAADSCCREVDAVVESP